jgi:hypothetical protein
VAIKYLTKIEKRLGLLTRMRERTGSEPSGGRGKTTSTATTCNSKWERVKQIRCMCQEERERRMVGKGVKKGILKVMFSQQYLNVR